MAIVDYGMGNLRSVVNAVSVAAQGRFSVESTADGAQLQAADRIVFPGQGAAADCMRALGRSGLDELLPELAQSKPFLGICMGLQVLFQRSDENGGVRCLGLFEGQIVRFDDPSLKVPHMGWNKVRQHRAHPMWHNIPDNSMFYFAHSYHPAGVDQAVVAGSTEYGGEFAAVLARDNIFALQCHPEKSATVGLQLFSNFLTWDGG